MKSAIRLLTILMFLAAFSILVYLSTENNRLADDVDRLEAELGKMVITLVSCFTRGFQQDSESKFQQP
ncbi:MAG: hypothetical protein NTW52_16710 [Planctomycetota bacterium]|nr:hypothetical protein [Planctomycetota bacterium]